MKDWGDFVEYRPNLSQLLGDDLGVLGHAGVKDRLSALGASADLAELLVLTGTVGVGKSALMGWFRSAMGGRAVDLRDGLKQLTSQPRADGTDVRRLINAFRDQVREAGPQAVLIYDDIDHEFRQEGMIKFVHEAITQLDVGSMVVTMATSISDDGFPIPTSSISLDRRVAAPGDMDELLTLCLAAVGQAATGFDNLLRRALYDLSEQTSDFGAIKFLIEMLLARAREVRRTLTTRDLHSLLTSDFVVEHRLPAVGVDGGHLTFSRKDKTEQLSDLIYQSFTRPAELAAEAADKLPGFDPRAFLDDARASYSDARMSLCLTTSPVDLVTQLLPRRDIRAAINRLDLDPSSLFAPGAEEAHLLIRGLGFTLIEEPRGLADFRSAIVAAGDLLTADPDPRIDVVNSAAFRVVQQIEAVFNDLLHIWGSFVFGSVRACVDAFNATYTSRPLNLRRLTAGQVVGLLGFINASAGEEDVEFRLRPLRLAQPMSKSLLHVCDDFVALRNEQVHFGVAGSPASGAPRGLVRLSQQLVASGLRVLEEAENSFPAVIKLSEIVFDEYSRRIFRGVDANGDDVRFSLSNEVHGDHLEVAAHYYMLPRRRVVVNPYVVPRSGTAASVLFERADEYVQHSATQAGQAEVLLDLVTASPGDRLIDVGCGGGRDAVILAQRFPEISVLGIDKGPDMVRIARQTVTEAGVANVAIEEADLLSFSAGEVYDVVYSSSVMHWFGAIRFEDAYRRLHHLLRKGGRLYVHQGGKGTYRGLHRLAQQVITEFGYGHEFLGFSYPFHYPSREELAILLSDIGFIDVEVDSKSSDGRDNIGLHRDFSEAGLKPYLDSLPEAQRDLFRQRFLDQANEQKPDLYTHRLYATARRP